MQGDEADAVLSTDIHTAPHGARHPLGSAEPRGSRIAHRVAGRARAESARITAPLRTSPGYRRYYASTVANALGSGIATGAVSMTIPEHRWRRDRDRDAAAGADRDAGAADAGVRGGRRPDPPPDPAGRIVGGVRGYRRSPDRAGRDQDGDGRRPGGLGAVTFAVSSFIIPAQEGIVRSLVSLEHLREANALAKLTRYSATIVGPSVGGVLVAAFGTPVTLGIDAMSYFTAAALMARVPVPALKRSPTRFRTDVAGMWTIATSTQWLWVNVLAGAFGVACWHIGYGIVGITYVRAHLGGPAAWGVIASCLGGGMVAGAVISLVWPPVRAGWRNRPDAAPWHVHGPASPSVDGRRRSGCRRGRDVHRGRRLARHPPAGIPRRAPGPRIGRGMDGRAGHRTARLPARPRPARSLRDPRDTRGVQRRNGPGRARPAGRPVLPAATPPRRSLNRSVGGSRRRWGRRRCRPFPRARTVPGSW
ncbi:hypothetical protein EBO15_28155 [Actinomadura harenae]|uniref:MFS transporter n=1 Tax=Actinomadura harenae TaxID=2483351 RepID=A0A3M2LSX8_9ACTN|nr:hypothetical protein EBO15_28155 [Actinomadura harenae]